MTTSQVNFRELLKRPACFLGLGFGSGLAPKAPGTFGTIAAIPIYWLIKDLPTVVYLVIILVAFIAGIWICQQSADWIGKDDPSAVVWDEIVGYLITMIVAPSGWQWLLLGFVLFRFFDIVKPWPISWADRSLHGGFGIIVDDVIAGLFAWATMQIIYVIQV
ncbi:MAG: phosphatidylglycerophosphatase A [Gammaproteobacteria bacterium]|nr:MAG: phosphatidylglycerophosphatase A [Gammaproteobacteria bacterium]